MRELPSACPVGEHPIVKLIGGDDAAAFQGGRDSVDAPRQLGLLPVHRRNPTGAACALACLLMPAAGPKKLFVALRDAPERRAALKADIGSAERYRLYGIDQLVSRGVEVRHNLERPGRSPLWARAADRVINRGLYGLGGYGGVKARSSSFGSTPTASSLALPIRG